MVKKIVCLLVAPFLLFACASTPQAPAAPTVVTVYATLAAQPWLTELFVCANAQGIILQVTPADPQIYLRLGEPANLTAPAYQIDEEEILVVADRQNPTPSLSLEQTQAAFAGRGASAAPVWVYASDADLQMWFDQVVMNASGVAALARVASDPQNMTDALRADPNSIGILSARWMTESLRKLYSAGKAPVLAIASSEADDAALDLIACLSK